MEGKNVLPHVKQAVAAYDHILAIYYTTPENAIKLVLTSVHIDCGRYLKVGIKLGG